MGAGSPAVVVDLANDISRWSLVPAIAALGMKTSFKQVFAAGWRPVCLICAETARIAGLVLMAVRFTI